MKEEGGGEAVRSKCSNSISQLCVSSHCLQLFSSLLSCDMKLLCATPEPGSLSGVTLGHKRCHLLSLPRTRLSDGILMESAALPLQQQENEQHQQRPSPPAWVPVLLQDAYLYLSQCGLGAAGAWTPLCCPLRRGAVAVSPRCLYPVVCHQQ